MIKYLPDGIAAGYHATELPTGQPGIADWGDIDCRPKHRMVFGKQPRQLVDLIHFDALSQIWKPACDFLQTNNVSMGSIRKMVAPNHRRDPLQAADIVRPEAGLDIPAQYSHISQMSEKNSTVSCINISGSSSAI